MKIREALEAARGGYVRRASWPMTEPSACGPGPLKAPWSVFENALGERVYYDNESMYADDWIVAVTGTRADAPAPVPNPALDEWRDRWATERARVETLAAMVRRAAAEIRSEQFRRDLLADLTATLEEK